MDMLRIVPASSTVEPENMVTLASRMSGLIFEMNVREGARLNEGDILLRFDIEEQQAELERARAELELASAVYDWNQTFFEREAISRARFCWWSISKLAGGKRILMYLKLLWMPGRSGSVPF